MLYRLFDGKRRLSWSDVIHRWQDDAVFRRLFISVLADAPFAAFFCETPAVDAISAGKDFEFVLSESTSLAGVDADTKAFSKRFAAVSPGSFVTEFANLSGDAWLIVPCPVGPSSVYSHIGVFAARAPDAQQHQFWLRVGQALECRISAEPTWVSTSGLGIHWLHVRLDSAPKYYTFRPYRRRCRS